MLTFALKSAIILALFYWVFFALLSKETFHRLNRITLLSALALSVFLPLTPLTVELPIVEAAVEVNSEDVGGVAMIEEETEASLLTWLSNLPWLAILAFVYYAGVAVSLLILLVQSVSLMRYMQHGLRHTDAFGNTVILKPGKAASFSIFRTIVMSVDDYEHNRDSILRHEQAHIHLGHTFDLLFLEAVRTIQWFNPFVWLLGRDLRSIHEYEADMSVLNQGIDSTQYQRLLVSKAAGPAAFAMINGFNHSQLKTRIIMINKQKSSPISWARYIALLPMLALAFVVSANVKEVPAQSPDDQQDRTLRAVYDKDDRSLVILDANEWTGKPLVICNGKRIADINSVSKDDIAKIEVFKDVSKLPSSVAEIASQYAEDAKNGVVIITLKDGERAYVADSPNGNQDVRVVSARAEKKDTVSARRNDVFTVVEQQPEYPGGSTALMEYIRTNLRYPEPCVKDSIEGRVTLSFVVEKDGSVTEITKMRSPNEELTKEAIRVVSAMPNWIPGKQRGEAVRVRYVLPVTFRLK